MLNFLSDQTKAESLETSKQVSKTVSVSSSTVLQAGLLQNEPEFMHTMREREKERGGKKIKREDPMHASCQWTKAYQSPD